MYPRGHGSWGGAGATDADGMPMGCRWARDGGISDKKMIDMFNGNSRILKWRNVSTILFGGIFPYIERWPLIDMLFKIDGHDN